MSTEEFWGYQTTALREMYDFALQRVPFYKEHPELYPTKLSPQGSALDLLRDLPILEKATVKANNTRLWPEPPLPLTSFHTTSGTTGTPLRLPGTIWERGMVRAISEEWYLRVTGHRKPKSLLLSGFLTPSAEDRELVWKDHITGNLCLSIYSLNQANRARIVEYFNELKPNLIFGYASAVQQLALLFEGSENPWREHCVAIVTSELLQPHWRETIEASLCRRVFDMYGSQEGAHLVIECEAGSRHIHPLVGIVEIVDDAGQVVRPGETGRVLVTGLIRRSMPLFRYAIGDMAEFTGYATGCSCGLGWPTIGVVGGRTEELVRTRDGRAIGMLGYSVLKDLRGIKEAQIVQKGYEQFVCNIVRSETETVSGEQLESQIRSQMNSRLQLDVHVQFNYLDAIPRGANGKFKAVVVDFEENTPVR
jgi:phenylacetate-CoA ligase